MLIAIALGGNAKGKIYDIKVTNADGKEVKMKQYKGKVMLIVNTATRCGFTPQYKQLEDIYEKYHQEGLEILDFPCNQFGNQAPGSIAEIRQFCTANYNTQFEQFQKIDVNGDNAAPLFTFLKSKQHFGGFDTSKDMGRMMDNMMRNRDADYDKNNDIKWNFTKFLVDRKGNVVRRFEPTDSMEDVEKAIKDLL